VSPAEVLRRANTLIRAGGWAGPEDATHHCQELVGRDRHTGAPVWAGCFPLDEGVVRLSVSGAIFAACATEQNRDELLELAWDALERVVEPAWWLEKRFLAGRGWSLVDAAPEIQFRARQLAIATVGQKTIHEWLRSPDTTQEDVLRALTRAVLRSEREKRT
jgi:hypothetical protein